MQADDSVSDFGVKWLEPESKGGALSINYRLWQLKDNETEYSIVADEITGTSYQISGLELSSTYQFKLQARNTMGYSPFSNVYTLNGANVPESPTAVKIEYDLETVTISWTAPLGDGGSEITGYQIFVQTDDGAYTQILSICDMTAEVTCSV